MAEDRFGRLVGTYQEMWLQLNQSVVGLNNLSAEERVTRMQEFSGAFNRDFDKATEGIFENARQRERFNQLSLQFRGFSAFNDPVVQQRLNLTLEQRQKFNQLAQEWDLLMAELLQSAQPDAADLSSNSAEPELTASTTTDNLPLVGQDTNAGPRSDRSAPRSGNASPRGSQGSGGFLPGGEEYIEKLRKARRNQLETINSMLNDRQRKTWQEMTGEPYDFPTNSYLRQNNLRSATGAKSNKATVPKGANKSGKQPAAGTTKR